MYGFSRGRLRLVVVLLIATSLRAFAATAQTQVPQEYFGLHIHHADRQTKWPAVPFGSWRLWDAGVNWRDIEPREGRFDFRRLDRNVELAQAAGVELLLPLSLTPTWASIRPTERSAYGPGHAAPPERLDDWRRYVKTVADRYAGKVRAYEVWNEPNADGFFSGSVQDMVSLACTAYQTIKAVDPAALVVSPSATHQLRGVEWFESFVLAGGRGCFDVVGFHFYTFAHEPPEQLLPLVAAMRGAMARQGLGHLPLWNTESGWYLQNRSAPVTVRWKVWDQAMSAAFVARALILGLDQGLGRFYWYAWDDGNLGLLEMEDGSLKPAAHAYARVQEWLGGASRPVCSREAISGNQICSLVRDGKTWRIVWNPVGVRAFNVPGDWAVRLQQPLSGAESELGPDTAVSIGPEPLLMRP